LRNLVLAMRCLRIACARSTRPASTARSMTSRPARCAARSRIPPERVAKRAIP